MDSIEFSHSLITLLFKTFTSYYCMCLFSQALFSSKFIMLICSRFAGWAHCWAASVLCTHVWHWSCSKPVAVPGSAVLLSPRTGLHRNCMWLLSSFGMMMRMWLLHKWCTELLSLYRVSPWRRQFGKDQPFASWMDPLSRHLCIDIVYTRAQKGHYCCPLWNRFNWIYLGRKVLIVSGWFVFGLAFLG